MKTERIPPHSMEAEMCCLGSMLLDRDAIGLVADSLAPDDFYRTDHRQVFAAVVSLWRENRPTDLVVVPEELRRRGQLETVGGVAYLAELAECVPTAINVEHYAEIVRQRATLRAYITAAQKTLDEAWDAKDDIDEWRERTEKRLIDVLNARGGKAADTIGAAARRVVDELKQPPDQRERRSVSTGFSELDFLTGGLVGGELIIVAAPTSVGKTSIATQFAQHISEECDGVSLYFTVEMTADELASRVLCGRASVDSRHVRSGEADSVIGALEDALPEVERLKIHIDNTATTLGDIRSAARRLHARTPLSCIIVDYLQLYSSGQKHENRNLEVAYVSAGLKRLAMELRVPVVALSQLSREHDKAGREPKLSDLRDSGAIEQDANQVYMLWRPDSKAKENVRLIVAKHRNGSLGAVHMRFDAQKTRFVEIPEGNVPPEMQRPTVRRAKAVEQPF